MRIKLPLYHLEEVACELNLAFYQSGVLGDANKVVASPIKKVACELNLASTQAGSLGDMNKVVTSPPR